jgi:DMSO/TMAO reductase YedYZ molybdopterin-dependent catalytic subunit
MRTTRGFTGRRYAIADEKRVPPGQYVTDDFPVLSAGPTPHTPLDRWTLTLQDGGSLVGNWTWEEFQALPRTELTVDIHCVTKWSKLGTVWEGVSIDDLLSAAGLQEPPPAPYLMAHCDGGYTTNLPFEDLLNGKGLVATRFDGEPLAPETRRPGASPGPASLLLEVRQVGPPAAVHGARRPGLLGVSWLPHLR